MELIENDGIDDGRKTRSDNKFLKEDLKIYYIDEEKSISEISRIYGCDWQTVKRKLKLYKIPIRPKGAFAISEDGESLHYKYCKDEISRNDYENERVKKMGYKNHIEYENELAKNKGYKDVNEYNRKMSHKRGKHLPMSENKNCPKYLGVHICENKEFISKIINIIESMPENNPGYDVICTKNKKLDVKCVCLGNNRWVFNIDNNKIADYFLMIAFDNRENLNVQHIWLVKGDTTIKKTTAYRSKEFIVNEKNAIDIGKGIRALKRWSEHEITDRYKLGEVQKVCDDFKLNKYK